MAAVCGLAYFWFVYFRRGAGARAGAPVFSPEIGAFVPLVILGYLAWIWLLGADTSALTFKPAEVSFLFPAPVTRRQILGFKLARGQVQVLLTATLWVALFHKGAETLSPPLRVAGFWVFLSTLNLHRLGVALGHAASTSHGWRGVRRQALPIAVLGTIAGVTIWGVWQPVIAAWAEPDARAGLHGLVQALQTGPVRTALWPIRATIELAFAGTTVQWLTALPGALAVLGVNLFWVMWADHAFEESAAEASAIHARKMAARRSRLAGEPAYRTTRRVGRTIPLTPQGSPWVAILWKNVLSLTRSGGLRTLVAPGALAIGIALACAGRSEVAEQFLLLVVPMIALALAFFAPMFTRNDLRTDLLQLPMLKTLPLGGGQIVMAQILAGALPVAVGHTLLVVAAVIANNNIGSGEAAPRWVVSGLAAASPVVLVALNSANFAMHNAMVLLFPSWVRLGSGGTGGVESMGLGILTFVAVAVALLVLLILPTAIGVGVYVGAGAQQLGALVAGLCSASVVVGGELWLLVAALGRAFERIEPSHVA